MPVGVRATPESTALVPLRLEIVRDTRALLLVDASKSSLEDPFEVGLDLPPNSTGHSTHSSSLCLLIRAFHHNKNLIERVQLEEDIVGWICHSRVAVCDEAGLVW